MEAHGTPATTPGECPHCGEPDTHGDDFCHECGHAFDFSAGGATAEAGQEVRGEACPTCRYGEIQQLSYGVRQCDSCGYTARDGSPT